MAEPELGRRRVFFIGYGVALSLAVMFIAYEIKLYGDAEYKRGCIWQMVVSGHANRVGECPIYPVQTGDLP